MALTPIALTTLANAKLVAGVASADTSDDSLFERLIASASVAISVYCDRVFGNVAGLPEYVETISATNRQTLILKQWPIVGTPEVVSEGVTLVFGTDFTCETQDRARGHLYRETGWQGRPLIAGLTADFAGMDRGIVVTYTAGYLLPGDTHYSEGVDGSLPTDIQNVCEEMVAERYWATKRGTVGGNVRSLSEGGLSYSFGKDSTSFGKYGAGLSDSHAIVLNAYKRFSVA